MNRSNFFKLTNNVFKPFFGINYTTNSTKKKYGRGSVMVTTGGCGPPDRSSILRLDPANSETFSVRGGNKIL